MTILNINENPLIDCYNFESFPYNIISLKPSYSDWIASNYIDLCIHKDCENASVPFKSYLFDYTQIPGMKVEKMDSRISYKLLEHKKCIKNTISYLITNNYLIDEDLLVQVEELIDLGNIIKNLSLKLILIEDKQLIFKIVQYFEEMEHKEKK